MITGNSTGGSRILPRSIGFELKPAVIRRHHRGDGRRYDGFVHSMATTAPLACSEPIRPMMLTLTAEVCEKAEDAGRHDELAGDTPNAGPRLLRLFWAAAVRGRSRITGTKSVIGGFQQTRWSSKCSGD